ncbi:Hypothetical protein GSB_150817, partial [Giardia duodenalis]
VDRVLLATQLRACSTVPGSRDGCRGAGSGDNQYELLCVTALVCSCLRHQSVQVWRGSFHRTVMSCNVR